MPVAPFVRVTVKGGAKTAQRYRGAGGRFISHISQLIEDELIPAMYAAYNRYAPVASGELKDSLDVEFRRIGGRMEVLGTQKAVNIRGNRYAYYADQGRGAGGMPPVQTIEKWMNVKGILPRAKKRGGVLTTRQAAFEMAKGIALNGTIGNFYEDEVLSDLEFNIQQFSKDTTQALTASLR